ESNAGLARFNIVDRQRCEVMLPETEEVIAPALPGEPEHVAYELGGTRRQQLAIWLVSRDNSFMARRAANWAWAHLMGRGLVHPADDMSPQNTPSHPELLDELTEYFTETGFDLKRLLQTIALT